MRVSLAIADTYLEDGLGSVSAVLREGGAVAASLSYSPWGEEELATESLPGYGDRFERPHYGYNAEPTSPEGSPQCLRARWYDPSGSWGYGEVEPCRFVSADGTRVFRMKDSDLAGKDTGGVPHVHFEVIGPSPTRPDVKMTTLEKSHTYFDDIE